MRIGKCKDEDETDVCGADLGAEEWAGVAFELGEEIELIGLRGL